MMVKRATSKLLLEIQSWSKLKAWELAPDEYEIYKPSFQADWIAGRVRSSSVNAGTRYVAKGNYSTAGLVESSYSASIFLEDMARYEEALKDEGGE